MGDVAENLEEFLASFARKELMAAVREGARQGLGLQPAPGPVCEEPKITPVKVGHLYAIEIVNIGTKIGVTTRPAKRIRRHEVVAHSLGVTLGRKWMSIAHLEFRDNERQLMLWGANDAERLSEVIPIAFDETFAFIEALPMTGGADG